MVRKYWACGHGSHESINWHTAKDTHWRPFGFRSCVFDLHGSLKMKWKMWDGYVSADMDEVMNKTSKENMKATGQ